MEPHDHDPPAELPEWWNETWQQGWEQFVWQHFMAKGKGKGDKGGKGETPTPMTPGPVNPIPFVMPAKATGPPPPPPHAADEFVEVPVESPSEMPPVVGPSAAPATTAKAAPAVAVAKENEPKRGGKGAMPPPEPVGAPKAGKGGQATCCSTTWKCRCCSAKGKTSRPSFRQG